MSCHRRAFGFAAPVVPRRSQAGKCSRRRERQIRSPKARIKLRRCQAHASRKNLRDIGPAPQAFDRVEHKGGMNMANPTYEIHANDAASKAGAAQFNVDRTYPGRWTVTFNNPPINMFVPSTIVELGVLM